MVKFTFITTKAWWKLRVGLGRGVRVGGGLGLGLGGVYDRRGFMATQVRLDLWERSEKGPFRPRRFIPALHYLGLGLSHYPHPVTSMLYLLALLPCHVSPDP